MKRAAVLADSEFLLLALSTREVLGFEICLVLKSISTVLKAAKVVSSTFVTLVESALVLGVLI